MEKKYVWVVEMEDMPNRWMPTVGCALNRAEGRIELSLWNLRNPMDKFRLRKYSANNQHHLRETGKGANDAGK